MRSASVSFDNNMQMDVRRTSMSESENNRDNANEEQNEKTSFRYVTMERVKALREEWQTIPFSTRMMILCVTVLIVVAALLGGLVEVELADPLSEVEHHPAMILKVSNVLAALVEEDRVSANFIDAPATTTAAAVRAARQETDVAMAEAYRFYDEFQSYLRPEGAVDGHLSLPSALATSELFELRQRLLPKVFLTSVISGRRYAAIIKTLTTYLQQLSNALGTVDSSPSVATLATIGQIAVHVLHRHSDAAALFHASATISLQQRAALGLAVTSHHAVVHHFTDDVVPRLTNEADGREFINMLTNAKRQRVYDRMASEINHLLSVEPPASTKAAWVTDVSNITATVALQTAAEATAYATQDFGAEKIAKVSWQNRILIIIVCCIVALSIIYTIIDRLWNQSYTRDLAAAHIMREAIARVEEYSKCFELFRLSLPQAPEGMMGTATGEIEQRLQRCYCSLQALAFLLPPKLLSYRNSDTHRVIEAVRSIERGQTTLSRSERSRIKTSHLRMLKWEDVEARPSDRRMKRLTAVESRDSYVYCLAIDLTSVHRDLIDSSVVTQEAIANMYPRILQLFEEVVLQFGGIMQAVWLDHAIAVWEGTKADAADNETGFILTNAASTVVSKLNHFKKLHPDRLEAFKVHLAMLAGEVTIGVFGNHEFKTLQMFGGPMISSRLYASVNDSHGTHIVCDENIRREIQMKTACKPIELVRRGLPQVPGEDEAEYAGQKQDVVYEVLSAGSKKEEDLESRLAVYTRAFDLYAQRYYREALKAFRGYTKQYGYDRSVERIQSLMTGE